jgi:hypothetical protein
MAMNSIRCPVLGARVTQVTDLEGIVTRIICPSTKRTEHADSKKSVREAVRWHSCWNECPRTPSTRAARCACCAPRE